MALYDAIGINYQAARQPDPRISTQISAALGDARSVVNVGAGTGSYETSTTVLAIEPSAVMIAQRPVGAAPVLQAAAESIPLVDDCADAVMALLTVHHWSDLGAGIAELRRIARQRVAVLTWDQTVARDFWFLTEYVPQARALEDVRAVPIDRLVTLLGGARVEPVLVPHDCTDGFPAAYWRRPEAYLDPAVRAAMSTLAQTGEDVIASGIARLAGDLRSGTWHERHADLLTLSCYDGGYRLLISE